jgi:hypothetical protein
MVPEADDSLPPRLPLQEKNRRPEETIMSNTAKVP